MSYKAESSISTHHSPHAPKPPPEPRLQNHGPVLQPKGEIEPIRDEAACLNAVSAVSTKPPLVTIQITPAALQGRFKLSDPNRDRNRPPAISRQPQPNARSGGRLGAGNTNPASPPHIGRSKGPTPPFHPSSEEEVVYRCNGIFDPCVTRMGGGVVPSER